MVTAVLGSAYAGIYVLVKERIDRTGEKRVETNTARYQFVSEAFGGIKEVKLRGKEEAFLDRYDGPSRRYSQAQAHYKVINKAPRYILEAIALGGIVLIAIYLIAVQDNIRQVIPMLGLYAFAGYRLMPALQQAFVGFSSARFNIAALEAVHRDLQQGVESPTHVSKNGTPAVLTLDDRLLVDEVSFTYPEAEEPAIRNLSFEIPAHSSMGFVGKTGSGKTTTVDLILGLLQPQSGIISVDGTPLRDDDTIRQWQRDIGYVPQQIYLSDDTVVRNIAFGVPEEDIDMDRVRDAARRAHIGEFVKSELPERWNTMVGERGVKLSGGQRQRIGIARALYHRPSVLVFDEATSALDQSTEANVMEAIYELEGDHTMLVIAHRLSTVRRADKIVMLEQGRKAGEGEYDELAQRHSKFRSMALS
jgi:ATP-binding cassette subfamily C protein